MKRETLQGTRKALTTLAVAALTLAGQQTYAVPITGDVEITGIAIADGPPDVATQFTGFDLVNVLAGTDDYASVSPLTPVTAYPFEFGGSILSPAPLNPLWEFTSGGLDYSFVLETIKIEDQGTDSLGTPVLKLSGTGVAKITGFDDTPSYWSLTAQGPNSRFSFSSSAYPSDSNTPDALPDGASTLLLLGAASTLVGFARRRVQS